MIQTLQQTIKQLVKIQPTKMGHAILCKMYMV
jgi:hypothetical protein